MTSYIITMANLWHPFHDIYYLKRAREI